MNKTPAEISEYLQHAIKSGRTTWIFPTETSAKKFYADLMQVFFDWPLRTQMRFLELHTIKLNDKEVTIYLNIHELHDAHYQAYIQWLIKERANELNGNG